MGLLKQSTTRNLAFLMIDSTDHLTGKTGLTVTVTLSKDAGAFAAAGGTVTEISSGWYKIALTTTDTNTLGDLGFHCTATGADATDFKEQVVALLPGDNVTVGTNNDKTGYSLTQAFPTNFSSQSIDASGRVDVGKIAGTAQTARDIGASVLLSAGTGTGQLDFTSGVVKANLAQILGTALTETAGQIAAAFKQFFNIASPTSTMNTITAVTTATNLTTNNDKTGYALTAGEKTTIEGGVWDVTMASHLTSGTTGASLNGAGSAGDPWTTALPGAYGAGTAGNIVGNLPSASAIATAVWAALTSALTTVGSIGLRLVTDIDATISSRNATTPPTAAAVSTQVWSEAIPGSFGAGTAGSKLNSASSAGDPWATAVPGAYASGTAGNILGNRVDAAVSSRMATFTLPTNFSSLAIDGSGRVTVGSIVNGAIAAATFAANALGAVWDEARSSHTTAGTFGQGVASVQGNITGSVASVTNAVDILQTAADKVWSSVTRTLSAFGFSVTVGTNSDKTGYALTSGEHTNIAADVLDATATSHNTAGTIGAKINSAASAGDPLGNAVPGSYAVGTAGYRIGTYLDAAVSSRASGSVGGVVGPGSRAYPITVTRPDGVTPIEGVAVWVTTDAAGTNVVAGALATDTLGRINGTTGFMLDPGTYQMWRQHGSWNFTNPTQITVT